MNPLKRGLPKLPNKLSFGMIRKLDVFIERSCFGENSIANDDALIRHNDCVTVSCQMDVTCMYDFSDILLD